MLSAFNQSNDSRCDIEITGVHLYCAWRFCASSNFSCHSGPAGSSLYNYIENGELKGEGNSITEGIGTGRITKNLENCPLDLSFRISDNDALTIIFDLLKDEGLFLGGSSGINVAGAIEIAKELGPGHTVVTILCDSGQRYQSKIWNPEFLKSKD